MALDSSMEVYNVEELQNCIKSMRAGDRCIVGAGIYNGPIVLDGLRGTESNPIVISGNSGCDGFDGENVNPAFEDPSSREHSILHAGISEEEFRSKANKAAFLKQATGEFPGVYYIADEASLFIKNCQFVEIRDLYFDNCWPTAIYLDNCQNVTISGCWFRGGTYAIGATGDHTRHITVEKCHWIQNIHNKGEHWKNHSWLSIHGWWDDYENRADGRVNIVNDNRHFDGDFFCGWQIAGFVTLRNNVIEDAFNGIHLFNYDIPRQKININVVVEENLFLRVRDNAVEPERGAWNWVIRRNVFIDVYRWFSFEMTKSGWFYIYGNFAWYTTFPGRMDGKTGGSIFKFGKSRVAADGPHYFFHNSFHLRERIYKPHKEWQENWHLINNAISYGKDDSGYPGGMPPARPFAKSPAQLAKLERARLEGMQFLGNVIEGLGNIRKYQKAGVRFMQGSVSADPKFENPSPGKLSEFVLNQRSPAVNNGVSFSLQTREGQMSYKLKPGSYSGVYQPMGVRFDLDEEFYWLKVPDIPVG